MDSSDKRFFGIQEVAERFGVNASKLRYYEKEFPSLKPQKNRSGERVYAQSDIDHIAEIIHLTTEKGMKLAAVKAHLRTKNTRHDENKQMINKLVRIKKFLEELRDSLPDGSKPENNRPEPSETSG
ncbi:MerR family transcriptional regulator [Arsenicibacter rosenii]|uniref:HTH merR-type domain-containing protein n=1 Tax=Arsenicibacter rosenii TaxID=1750698 RepID=A0A1S2VK77_9BACT|nr:MerR family transcriptional regulator [Arsenicibacter rosenii]OIN59171.1 hypothetical protein BLX24_09230 [Arsenicibacter rosenii]